MEREEALEIARKLYNNSLFLMKDKEAMVTLIPELKESEDGRISKELIEFLKGSHYKPAKMGRWIAWLEKQGEQPQGKSALEAAKEEKVDNQNCVKPNDKVEPKFKIGQTIKKEGFNLGFPIIKIEDGFYYNDMGDNFPFTDQDNWELVEQKPWSEED